jgi:hypothetical protein
VVGADLDLAVPDIARKAICAHRLAVLREDPTVDPLDGHAMQTRLKVAVALMTLEGRTIVDTTDWTLAGYVMDVSTYTRERCNGHSSPIPKPQHRPRLSNSGSRRAHSRAQLQRCKDGIVRALALMDVGQFVAHIQLRRSLKSDVRDYFDAAIAELIADGHISAARTPKDAMYGGPPVDHRSTASEQLNKGWTISPPWTCTPHTGVVDETLVYARSKPEKCVYEASFLRTGSLPSSL